MGVTSISSSASSAATLKLNDAVQISVQKKAMDTQKTQAELLLQGMQDFQRQTGLGANIDISA